MHVVDLGGTVQWWERAPDRPAHVTVVNLHPQPASPGWATVVQGDACEMEGDFDLAFSNAVIEHVGGHQRRVAFAEAARTLAPAHWVQTPYRYFPIEPHYLFPGLQFLPVAARARILRRWPLVQGDLSHPGAAMWAALDVDLIGRAEMRYLFPGSEVLSERVGGLTKSLIALRRG
jgi:hypothetical protein